MQTNNVCIVCSTIGTDDISISFKILLIVALVIPLVPMISMVTTNADNLQRGQNYHDRNVTIQYGAINLITTYKFHKISVNDINENMNEWQPKMSHANFGEGFWKIKIWIRSSLLPILYQKNF